MTAVELLPVHQSVAEPPLANRGVSNYWGYSSLGFFAPHAAYAADRSAGRPGGRVQADGTGAARGRSRGHPRRRLQPHRGRRPGRTVADVPRARRADHYKLAPHSGSYVDTTGCGNTLDVGDLDVLRLVLDSLRYWVTEMHVDGFRFDLATALTRERMDVDERSPFLAAVHQDPVLRR